MPTPEPTPHRPPVPPPNPDPNAVRADRLRTAITTQIGTALPWRRSSWTAAFAALDRQVLVPGLLDAVLDWYCRHVGRAGVPRVLSASGFAARFLDLRDARARASNRRLAGLAAPDGPPPKMQRFATAAEAQAHARTERESERAEAEDQEAASVLQDTRNILWAEPVRAELPVLVSESLANMRALYAAARREGVESFCNVHGPPAFWAAAWVHQVAEIVHNWPRWNGRLRGWHWHPWHSRVNKPLTADLNNHGDAERTARILSDFR